MKPNQIIAATLLIGSKVYAYQETVTTEAWDGMDYVQREGLKNQVKTKLAAAINTQDLTQQTQTYVTDAPLESVTYHLAGPVEGAVASDED